MGEKISKHFSKTSEIVKEHSKNETEFWAAMEMCCD
jgi:hypothetical protein